MDRRANTIHLDRTVETKPSSTANLQVRSCTFHISVAIIAMLFANLWLNHTLMSNYHIVYILFSDEERQPTNWGQIGGIKYRRCISISRDLFQCCICTKHEFTRYTKNDSTCSFNEKYIFHQCRRTISLLQNYVPCSIASLYNFSNSFQNMPSLGWVLVWTFLCYRNKKKICV